MSYKVNKNNVTINHSLAKKCAPTMCDCGSAFFMSGKSAITSCC